MSGADAAGQLRLTAHVHDGTVVAGSVRSTRVQLAAAFAGRPADAVVESIPLLFGACAMAQQAAARAALRAARGEAPAAIRAAAAAAPIAAEALREHLWHVMIDWPLALDSEPARTSFAGWYRRIVDMSGRGEFADLGTWVLRACLPELLGMPAEAWARATDVQAVGERSGALVARLLALLAGDAWRGSPVPSNWLPECSMAAWQAAFASGLAGANALWHGEPRETGSVAAHGDTPLVRRLLHGGHRLAARLAARVCALIAAARQLTGESPGLPVDACAAGPHAGIARSETARGTLVHRIELRGDSVAHYEIVAPTDWNFHPGGAWVQEIGGRPVHERRALRKYLNAVALSLDPCIRYDIDIVECDAARGAGREPIADHA